MKYPDMKSLHEQQASTANQARSLMGAGSRPPSLADALAAHGAAIENFSDVVANLENRLGMILSPLDEESSAKALGMPTPPAHLAPAVHQVIDMTDKVDYLVGRLHRLLNRVEL